MELTLSSNRPMNTVLINAEGQAMYTSRTPSGKWLNQTTVISRVLPEYSDRKFDYGDYDDDDDDEEDIGEESSHAKTDDDESPFFASSHGLGLAELARIHWKIIGSSMLEYKGMQLSTGEYLQSGDIFGL